MMTPQITVQLIHIHGGLKGEIQDFLQTPITVGRLSSCSVRFPADEPGVSREHARIEREGNRFKLTDLSRFGTYVNGKQVRETLLRSGDVIEFGPGGPKASITMELDAASPQQTAPVHPEPTPAPPRAAPPPRPAAPAPVPAAPAWSPQAEGNEVPLPVMPPSQTAAPVPPASAAPTTPRATAPLVIQFGPTIRSYRELPVTLGSHSGADFIARHPGLRDRHAEFFYDCNAYWVRDLTGGLLTVNRTPVADVRQLYPNDQIECSPQGPLFRFLGEGRLAEIELPEEQGEEHAEDLKLADTAVKAGNGNFFSKFVKGFKNQ